MSHHGVNKRRICPVCLLRFETPEAVEEHMRKARRKRSELGWKHRAYRETEEERERRELQRRYQNAHRDRLAKERRIQA